MMKNLRFALMSVLMVFAGSVFAEDIIWSEDWTGAEANAVPFSINSSYASEGDGTKIYDANLAGGVAPELLIAKSGGSLIVRIDLNGKSGEMTLSYMANYDRITVSDAHGAGITFGEKKKTGNSYEIPLTVPAGNSDITLKFENTTSSNVRFDNAKLYQGTAKKAAGLSWGTASRTVTIGAEDNVFPTLSNENNLAVTYSSSEESVATIDAEGVITLVAAGKTDISAAFEGDDEYEAQTVTYTLTVNAAGDDPVVPVTGTITVAKALEIIEGLDNGAKTTEEYEVKGFVIGDPDFQRKSTDGSLYGNVNLQMADEVGGTAMLTVYRAKDLDNADFTEETINRIKEGDVVVFKGKLQKYVKDEVVTPELTNGYLISVNPDDTPVVKPAEPVFNPADGAEFSESIVVTITCATDGATIYYRNARATETYTVYTEPITLTETTMLEAYAEKDGVKSEKMGALYTKVETPVAEGIVFDFDNDYATLFPTLKGGVSSSDSDAGDFTETTSSIEIEGVTVIVSAKEEGKTNNNRIWTSAPRLRMYSGTFTVTGKDIVKIEFTANSNFNLSTETGTLDGKTWTGKADEVVFAVTKNTQINKIVVTLDTSTAIQAVESTRNDGIIYNMAGQRVEKAQKGLYIMNGRKFMVK